MISSSPIVVLTWLVMGLAVLIVVLSAVLVATRLRREQRERRRARLLQQPRRALLELVADPDDERIATLLGLPRPVWEALEPSAMAMLGKVRGEARDALVRVFDERGAAEHALADLGHRSRVRRARGAQTLGILASPEALEPLCRLLADREPYVRVVATRALGALADPRAAGPLLHALGDHVPAQVVADALAHLGAGALPALHEALRSNEPAVRKSALDALALGGATTSVGPITVVLTRDDALDVRVAAAEALGRISHPTVLTPLLQATAVENPSTLRAAAVRAIGTTGAVATADRLAVLLQDDDPRVRHEAAQALRRLGPAGVGQLERIVADAPEQGSVDAREALALAALDRAGG